MSLVEELQKQTVFELKSYAKKHDIDIFGANTKAEILETILNWVPIEEFPAKENSTKPEILTESGETIAVHTSRNLFWNGVGELNVGYNIVSKEASEKWLTHKAVRIATPDEIALFYGKK